MATIRLENITKQFRERRAVDGVSLTFAAGQLTVLVGPSGCGKTTLLRMIAGLEEPTDGTIWIDDTVVNDLPAWERNTAMVFQSYALYPHMTVFANLAFPLQAQKRTRPEIKHLVEAIAESLNIADLLRRKPRQLSGGQMQRVALGRALVRRPRVFLMDEPLSNLDAMLRHETRSELKRLQRDLGITTVYVTHDQEEAMTLADRLVVLRDGRPEQLDTPTEVYRQPATVFTARFIGNPPMNLLPCCYEPDGMLVGETFQRPVPARYQRTLAGADRHELLLGIRPEHMTLHLCPPDTPAALPVQVYILEPSGRETLVTLALGDTRIRASAPADWQAALNSSVWITFTDEQVHLYNRASGLRMEP